MSDPGLAGRWVRATWAGWLLGVPCIVVLALVGEAVGIGAAQVLVGAGMGAGIGFMQGRFMRSIVHKVAPWTWSCIVGLAIPFLLTDIAKAAGLDLPYSLQLAVAVGGLTAGAWQSLILRPRFHKTGSWVAASALGWTVAAGTAAVADSLSGSQSLRGLAGALTYLGIIAIGGVILGLVTSVSLTWMLQRERAFTNAMQQTSPADC